MLYPTSLLDVIEDERRREIEAAARARLVRANRPAQAPRGARRTVGRLFVRFGVWLLVPEPRSGYDVDGHVADFQA